MSRTAAISLSWKSDSHVASSIVSMAPAEARPALCTTPSMRPQRATAASTKASRSAGPRDVGPLRQHVAAYGLHRRFGRAPGAPRRARTRRRPHPRRPARVASASPSPSVPPVMRTVLPASSRSIRHSSFGAVVVTSARKASASRCERRRTKRRPGPPRVVLGFPVALTVDPVAGGRPGDDRFLGVEGEQVGPGLLVPVPELLAGDDTPHRAPDGAGHHGGVRQVEPHDGVGPLPHDVPHGRVVAVHDPAGPPRSPR